MLPTRTCVICRTQGPTDQLLRVQAHGDQICIPMRKKNSSRGAWVCLRASCLEKLSAQPGRASRTLRQRINGSPDLKAAAYHRVWTQVKQDLRLCMRSGLIVTNVESLPGKIKPSWLVQIRARPEHDSKTAAWTSSVAQVPTCDLPVSDDELGHAIGHSSCKVIGLRPGRPSKHLVRQLHLLVEAG